MAMETWLDIWLLILTVSSGSLSRTKSTTFIGAKVWNSLPDELRSMTILKEFKYAVRELHL